jgi:hypothetical protein
MSSRLLSKNIKFRISKTTILPVILYGCEICFSDIKGGTYSEGVSEQGGEENIWTVEE